MQAVSRAAVAAAVAHNSPIHCSAMHSKWAITNCCCWPYFFLLPFSFFFVPMCHSPSNTCEKMRHSCYLWQWSWVRYAPGQMEKLSHVLHLLFYYILFSIWFPFCYLLHLSLPLSFTSSFCCVFGKFARRLRFCCARHVVFNLFWQQRGTSSIK